MAPKSMAPPTMTVNTQCTNKPRAALSHSATAASISLQSWIAGGRIDGAGTMRLPQRYLTVTSSRRDSYLAGPIPSTSRS